MKSLTKIDLTSEQLAATVRAAFGSAVSITHFEEFQEGWFNTIYGIDLSDGRRVVLKLAPKPGVPVLRYERDLLTTEVAVYCLLEAAGVGAPRVLHHASEALLGVPWFIMDRINLPTYAKVKAEKTAEEKALIEQSLGRVNRALNSITCPAFGSLRSDGFRSSRWSDVVLHLADEVLADGRDCGATLPWETGRIRALIERHRAILDLITEPRLVHWDLHEGNTFVDGNEVRAVIDPDRALWGDPLMEVHFSDLLGPVNFVAGYGPGVADSPGAAVRRAVYDVYLALVMRVESDFRGFAADHVTWATENLNKTLERCAAL